jgi:type VI secretion system secreted protein Hcp
MAFDAVIKISTIDGEATDAKHEKWIELHSFSWAVTQPGARSYVGAGGAAGKATFTDFSITKALDRSSPSLFQACATGQHLAEVTVELCRATGDKQQYLNYKFSDVMVSAFQAGGASAGTEQLPMEQVAFNFAAVKITYTPIDMRTGKAQGPVAVGYDLQKGTKV